MVEEDNPIKEYLFNYIKKSENRFAELFSQSKMDLIIEDILDNCYYKVSLMENKEEALGVLTTGILHYMLTNAGLTSQRKVEHQGIEIDIVLPDMKTLEKDSKKTLIICIPKTSDVDAIKEKMSQLQTIQPKKQNIWLVLTRDLGFDNTYIVEKENSSFSKIIFDIAQFVNVQGHDKFKILRI